MKISIFKAISLLQKGEVVAVPTETVYGLAASLAFPEAIEKIYKVKGRPSSNPLIIHVGAMTDCLRYASFIPEGFFSLAEAFWPGPLTVVLPVVETEVPSIARASLPTAAFRVPSHPIAQEILRALPAFVAPSANISGKPSATKAEHVEHDFGEGFPVIDGKECALGLESTIVVFNTLGWEIARLGAITAEDIEAVLGYRPRIPPVKSGTPICPGQLFCHYSPKARLELSFLPYEVCPRKKRVVVGFTDRVYPGAEKCFSLGSERFPEEAAFRLFDVLRALDRENVQEAWVDLQVPNKGLWMSIIERLSKAAANQESSR
jgi:L-threonylcarbamoyladenylate synthase